MQNINKINSRTFRLFSELPSFMGGVVSIFDFRGIISKYNTDSKEEQDENSISSDWNMVGSDMRVALAQAHEERRGEDIESI